MTKATLGGTLTATNVETGAHLGNVNITGTLTIQAPDSEVYGMTDGTLGLKWTQNGTHLLAGTNPTITATGSFKFANVIYGGVECPVKAEIMLTGGTSTAHVNEFAFTGKTSECPLNGSFNVECKALIADEITGTGGKPLNTANGGAWLATGKLNAGVASLDIFSEVNIHTAFEPKSEFSSCFKKLTLESTTTAKPTFTFDSSTKATKITIGGLLTATLEAGHLGNLNIGGTLTIAAPQSGVYGIT